MAFRSSSQARVYAGILAAAAYARTAGASSVADMHDITTLADTAKAMLPGPNTSTFQVAGPLDADASANGQFDAFATQKDSGGTTPVTYMPLGTDGHAWLIDAIHTTFDTSASHSGTVDWSLDSQTDGIADMAGVILENNTTVTVDTNGTANNNGAGTTQGAAFHLHVTAYSGFTSDDIIVEGSTTGSFGGEETTIATFTQVTGVTSERVVVTGTVPRYLRVVDDVLGTGSVTRLVAVSRR